MNNILEFLVSLIYGVFLEVYNTYLSYSALPDSILPFCVTLIVIALFLAIYLLFRITVSFIQFVFNL